MLYIYIYIHTHIYIYIYIYILDSNILLLVLQATHINSSIWGFLINYFFNPKSVTGYNLIIPQN